MSHQPLWSDSVSDEDGRSALQTTVFAHRHGPREFLPPPRVRPPVVREFIHARFSEATTADQTRRMGDLVRFYQLSDASRKFLTPLERRERSLMDCLRAVECVRVLGDAGDNSQQQFAGEYFDYLARHALFPEFGAALVASYFSLDPRKKPDALEQRLDQEIRRLLPEQEDPEWPKGPCREFVEWRENDLPLVAVAKARKDALLTEADDLRRATGWARLYLGLEDPGGVRWAEVAGYALLAEVVRSSRENAIAGLHAALAALKPGESREYLAFARQRGARAIAYLGGTLTAEQAEWLGEMPTRRHLLAG